jgi:hypothetical protein
VLGLPPVRAVRDGGRSRGLACSSFWPQAVRPPGYYAMVESSVRSSHWDRSTMWPRGIPRLNLASAAANQAGGGSPTDVRPTGSRSRMLKTSCRTIMGPNRGGLRTLRYRGRSPIRPGHALKPQGANVVPRKRDLRPGSARSRHRRCSAHAVCLAYPGRRLPVHGGESKQSEA